MTYTAKPMTIRTKTNLHVGSESINYDIVDKTVQRDSITHTPIINASSHKGALRHHFQSDDTIDDKLIEIIFGKEKEDASQGYVKFLDSYLLFLPLRANNQPFYYVTSKSTLLGYCDFYDTLGFDLSKAKESIKSLDDNTVFHNLQDDTYIEDVSCTKSDDTNIKDVLKLMKLDIDVSQVAIFSDSYFIDATKHLPVIARNKLNKEGKSENLWYEEIVPRESLFYTAMLDYTKYSNRLENLANNKIEDFYTTLKNSIVQIGANASIGFGLCRYTSLEQLPKKEVEDAK